MILLFPNYDTLRLALTSSIVSTEVTLAPAAVSFDEHGKIYLESTASLSKTTTKNLDKIGVKGSKRHASEHPEEVSCWPQIVPLVKESGTPEVSNQAPVLFELSNADDLPTLVTEMLRLGNDRQSFRWFTAPNAPDSQRVLLRVIGPPYYTLLRAIDASAAGTAGTVRAYLERSPRLWIELGHNHPLSQQIRVADSQVLLLRSPRQWIYLDETPFQDVYDVLQFKLPHSPVGWTESTTAKKMTVPLRLAAGNAADVPELWVLRDNAIEQLDTLVRDSDERLTQRLKFAVATSASGQRSVILRTKPSKLPPPALPLEDALGFKPFWKLPNLFVPVGRRLHPTLRRDAVRKLLADDPDQVVWLYPGAGNAFTPESVPDGAFRSLEDWVDYVIETEQEPLAAWIGATRFDFDHFVCTDAPGPKTKPDRGDKEKSSREDADDGKGLRGGVAAPRGPTRGKSAGPKASGPAEFLPETETARPQSEWVKRREELEEQFKAVEGGLDAPERVALWPELAIANAHAGNARSEAAICWLNAMWGTDPIPPQWLASWIRTEIPDFKNMKADEFDKRLTRSDPGPEDARVVIAGFLWLASQQPVPAWLAGAAGRHRRVPGSALGSLFRPRRLARGVPPVATGRDRRARTGTRARPLAPASLRARTHGGTRPASVPPRRRLEGHRTSARVERKGTRSSCHDPRVVRAHSYQSSVHRSPVRVRHGQNGGIEQGAQVNGRRPQGNGSPDPVDQERRQTRRSRHHGDHPKLLI